LIRDKTEEIAFLVRVKNVDFTESCKDYKNDDVDGLKIRIAVE
jgi:isoleucyl-tRNA synthetase